MVQDMLDPEYYVSRYGGQSTHFLDIPPNQDATESIPEELASSLSERQPLFIVPMPFCSPWWNESIQQQRKQEALNRPVPPPKPAVIPESPPEMVRKRDRDEEDASTTVMDHVSSDEPSHKAFKVSTATTGTPEEGTTSSSSHNNSPFPHGQESDWWPTGFMESSPDECPVLAKLYYDQSGPSKQRRLRLNDVVECVAVLSMEPWEADFVNDNDSFSFSEMEGGVHLPPPSRLPRIHVLSYRILDLEEIGSKSGASDEMSCGMDENTNCSNNNNPQEDQNNSSMSPKSTASDVLSLRGLTSNELLAKALFLSSISKAERKLVASHDYSLEQSQSSWEMERRSEQALGCCSLHLVTSEPKAFAMELKTVLQKCSPVVATVEWAAGKTRFPSKFRGRLAPSPWQLPKGSTLIVTIPTQDKETIPASHILEELVSQQRLPYTFEGAMTVPFDADYQVIVVSTETVQLPCTIRLPVSVDCLVDKKTNDLGQERLSLMRSRRIRNVGLTQQVLQKAQADFLARRQQTRETGREVPQAGDFHRWLALTRLFGRVRCADRADVMDWEEALLFDDSLQQDCNMD